MPLDVFPYILEVRNNFLYGLDGGELRSVAYGLKCTFGVRKNSKVDGI